MTFLIVLEFIRLVITPLVLVFNDYYEVITLNTAKNTPAASMLIFYETLWIILALKIKKKIKVYNVCGIENQKCNKYMTVLMVGIMLIVVTICCLAPEIYKNYRVITGVFTDKDFTSVEQSHIVNKYGTNFFKKLMLVISNYILKVIRILLPMHLIVWFYNKKKEKAKSVSIILILSPFLLVDDAIARSIYFVLFLLLIYNDLYGIEIKRLYLPIGLAGIMVVVYFGGRYKIGNQSMSLIEYISDKLVDYFAGLNIVSGSFNLPTDLPSRFHYFVGDILRTIPFANTIFRLNSSDTSSIFFNNYNATTGGQIPTTIGMGAYYFGLPLAPLYSALFAYLCQKYGRKAQLISNPYYKLVYIYLSFISALGISMYNIEITLAALAAYVQIIFPIFIICRIAYPKIVKGEK